MNKLNKTSERREQPWRTPFLILNDCGNCPLTFTQTLEDKYKFSINLKHLPQIFKW